MEYLTAVFSKLQVNPIKPLDVPQEAFPLALTLSKVLLSTSMIKLSFRKVNRKSLSCDNFVQSVLKPEVETHLAFSLLFGLSSALMI